MIDCSKCGHSNPVGSNYCSKCGNALTAAASASETTRVIVTPEEDPRTLEISAEDADALSSLPAGNALLIVTRGPDVGARHLLDKESVTAGRSPKSDIFLDDITRCEQVTHEMIDGWSAWRHLRNATARLASNLL